MPPTWPTPSPTETPCRAGRCRPDHPSMGPPAPRPDILLAMKDVLTGTGDTPVVDAATVVLVRDGEGGLECLMLRKTRGQAFGGLWGFPGGRVEPGGGEGCGGGGGGAFSARPRGAAAVRPLVPPPRRAAAVRHLVLPGLAARRCRRGDRRRRRDRGPRLDLPRGRARTQIGRDTA